VANHPRQDNESRVPWSIVFMTTGLIIVLTVVAIYLLTPATPPSPAELPALIPRLFLATPVAEAMPSLAAGAEGQLADSNGSPVENSEPALLPESPAGGSLPSEADAETAPRERGPVITGQPIRLVIPDLAIDAPVWEVGLEEVVQGSQSYLQWSVPAGYAAGWHNDSAPLGEPGNTVINGHHNIYGEIFRDLVDLEIGADLVLYDQAGSHTYRIAEQYILLERGQPIETRVENAQWIAPTTDERITFVTCWPYTDNSHRVIVVAYPVD
jgi:LPXTG-site transpeptidase (sortase) family protein